MADIRLEAHKIIYKVLKKNQFSDKLLDNLRKKMKEAEQDYALLNVLVKGVIKLQKNLDFIASQYTDQKRFANSPFKIKIVIYLALYQMIYLDKIPPHAAVNEAVELAKKLYGSKVANFVNALLRAYLRNPQISYPEDKVEKIALQYSFPTELIETWLQYWGETNTVELCEYFNQNPRLSLRVNKFATEPNLLKEYFRKRDIFLIESPATENIFTTSQIKQVLQDVAFSEGYFSIQDAAAALVVELADPHVNENNLDLFAAPGGKVTYMAELMLNTGKLTAVDKFPAKIKKIKRASERLQLSNIKTYAEDAFKFGPQVADYDRVLLDVPCSGWGVFQKKSELRWQRNQDMKQLLKLQKNALETGAKFVKPGGCLIYSTCTLNKAENEEQVENFLAKNKDFSRCNAADYLPERYVENGYLKTLPFRDKMDGAFAARLQKAED
ncbi:MAG: 16S rRNA (cytosine(967)-C(5))-methyltransferase RsmB [Candidatus Cloacimonadales bacterium]